MQGINFLHLFPFFTFPYLGIFAGSWDEDTAVSSKASKKKYANAIKCFGVELTPDNIAVAMVYFVQGVLGLSRIAVSFYLKDDLHLDPAEVIIFIELGSQDAPLLPLFKPANLVSASVSFLGWN